MSFNLKEILEELESYQDQELLEKDGTSVKRKEFYDSDKFKFKKNLTGNLELLRRLAFSERYKRENSNKSKENVMDYTDKAIEAYIKYGVPLDKVSAYVEKGFENALQGTGIETIKHAEINKTRIEEAKVTMKKNKLIEKFRKELTEKGDISPESLEKLEKTLQKIEGN